MSIYGRLVKRGILTAHKLEELLRESAGTGTPIEELLVAHGAPRHEVLFCLSEHHGVPFVEYDETVVVSPQIIRRMDMERLKLALWLPLSITPDRAEVIACRPDDPAVAADIRATLRVDHVAFKVALPSDLIRIIENNQDLNPGFPPVAGRTPLAKVRTFLADRRSQLSCYRTALAKGRTGLAFLRTGISFITISLVLFRVFGVGYLTIAEVLLFALGVVMATDGLMWYWPARKVGRKPVSCSSTRATGGTTVLEARDPGNSTVFTRTAEVAGAKDLRHDWNKLSPVMRRRFLASDRTDLAEERTVLAAYRTVMARARTGLAFMRTGIAFVGLGIALLRQFHMGAWTVIDGLFVAAGMIMIAEGFTWYLPGRRAGAEGARAVREASADLGIWGLAFPPVVELRGQESGYRSLPLVRGFDSPGIWATTGLALERTLLADRRNVMARLRTIMARSRTGLALIRTGMSISAVGLGLLVGFGTTSFFWTVFDAAMIVTGMIVIVDGLYWHVPAERTRREFPYCYGDLEITIPDYGTPAKYWRKVVFSQDDV